MRSPRICSMGFFLRVGSSLRSRMISPPKDHSCRRASDGLRRQVRADQVLQKRPEARHQFLAPRQFFLCPHPRTGPSVQPSAVALQQGKRERGGAVYRRDFRRRSLPPHGTHHDSKPLPSLSRICLSSRHIQCGPQEHRSVRAAAQGFGRSLLTLPFAGARLRPTRRTAF